MVWDQDRNPKVTTTRTNGVKLESRLGLMGRVTSPAWGPHISVIRGEPLPDPSLWGLYEGTDIRFKYDPESIYYNRGHFWLDVECDPLLDLREELGLLRQPRKPLHITIAVWADPVPDYVSWNAQKL